MISEQSLIDLRFSLKWLSFNSDYATSYSFIGAIARTFHVLSGFTQFRSSKNIEPSFWDSYGRYLAENVDSDLSPSLYLTFPEYESKYLKG